MGGAWGSAGQFIDHQVQELVHLVLVIAPADERGRVEDHVADLLGGEGVPALECRLYAVQKIVYLVLVVAAVTQWRSVERHAVDDYRG